MAETLFNLPDSPDDFGVLLPPAPLRKIDFSGLDFTTMRRAIIEYIKTYYPNDFNDYVASNGMMMLLEVVAGVGAKLALRSDILAQEGFLPSAKTEKSVVEHLKLIGQKFKRQTPAVTDIELTLNNPTTTAVEISPGLVFKTNGPDNKPIYYEVFRAPGDFTSNITIPAGKRGVIAYGIEGLFATPVTVSSTGGANQFYAVDTENVLEAPIFVTVSTGDSSEEWTTTFEPLERFTANDKVVEVRIYSKRVEFRFGNNINGLAPSAGQQITFSFRTGGGSRGRIGVNIINESRSITPLPPANAAVEVRFRNIVPSSGGMNAETLEEAKKRAPRDFFVDKSIVTDLDYAHVASSFSHPVFGSISKAMATLRTSLNTNLVELYVLAIGSDGKLVSPSAGLKKGLETYIEERNVLTDDAVVLDGELLAVDIDMNVVVHRNADATVVKENVESAITKFFDVENWEMGQPLYISNLIQAIESVDGIRSVALISPSDDILSTNALAASTTGEYGVGLNQIIVEGNRSIKYMYERGRN